MRLRDGGGPRSSRASLAIDDVLHRRDAQPPAEPLQLAVAEREDFGEVVHGVDVHETSGRLAASTPSLQAAAARSRPCRRRTAGPAPRTARRPRRTSMASPRPEMVVSYAKPGPTMLA